MTDMPPEPGHWAPPTGPPVVPPRSADPFAAAPQYRPGPQFPSDTYHRPPDSYLGNQRPWWGMGDIFLGAAFILALTIGFTIVGVIVSAATGTVSVTELQDGAVPSAMLGLSLIGQQASTALWPFVVSRWKGVGMAQDFGWSFKLQDLLIGPVLAAVLLGAAFAVSSAVAALLGGVPEEASNNAGFLSDAEGSPWLYVLVLGAVVGAPISEELLFRGLIQRAIGNRAGALAGIVVSSVIFALIHYIGPGGDGSWDGQIVLWATIGSVGLGLAVAAHYLKRIMPGVIAHAVFNALGTAAELFG